MPQLHYLTSNIQELNAAEHDLENNGIPRKHIHIFSLNDQQLTALNLPTYSEWSKRDITYYGFLGLLLGACLCICLILMSAFWGLTSSTGWSIIAFVGLGTIGFCTWEGGLIGVNKLNHHLKPYKHALDQGAILLVVDVDDAKEEFRARYTVESHGIIQAVA